MVYWEYMGKEKVEKMPIPGQRLSEEEAKKIIEKFGIEPSKEDKKAGRDLEAFIVITKDRGKEPEEKKKDVFHYIPKWEKIPDQELGPIPVGEVIEAIQKYYSGIDSREKYPTREAIRRLRKEKKNYE